jgi:heterodisulfide reductase subunit A-like polyferredoxin
MKSSLLFLALLIQTFVIAQNKVAIIGGGIAGVATAHYIESTRFHC